ncbi:MAG: hypothetical protein E7074_10750 [Bacteroidales bacterium]|nr:hypothetical protein [Bacteroidales bacterium]
MQANSKHDTDNSLNQVNNMNEENQNIEYKESWRDEYLKWICGFANAHAETSFVATQPQYRQHVLPSRIHRELGAGH